MPIITIEAKTYKELKDEKDHLITDGNRGKLVKYCNSSPPWWAKNKTFKVVVAFKDWDGFAGEKHDVKKKILPHNRAKKRVLGLPGEGVIKWDFVDFYDKNILKRKKERRETGLIKCPKCKRRKVKINIHAIDVICPKCNHLFIFRPIFPRYRGWQWEWEKGHWGKIKPWKPWKDKRVYCAIESDDDGVEDRLERNNDINVERSDTPLGFSKGFKGFSGEFESIAKWAYWIMGELADWFKIKKDTDHFSPQSKQIRFWKNTKEDYTYFIESQRKWCKEFDERLNISIWLIKNLQKFYEPLNGIYDDDYL